MDTSINGIIIKKTSPIYESEPMYYHDQNNFYNQVIEVDIQDTPMELLEKIKKIEVRIGRDLFAKKNTQRVIDIDILSINNLLFKNRFLTLPHPKIHERKFVLKPWIDIAPIYIIPKYELSVKELFLKLNYSHRLKIVDETKEVI